MQNSEKLTFDAPNLPKGGGAVTGLTGNMGAVGPDGAATFSLPLPISQGRGYAPSLGLSYQNQAGNGAFGFGWSVGVMSIRRRTSKGVPTYTQQDEFVGPEGEAIVPIINKKGEIETAQRNELLGVKFTHQYQVTTYRSRIEKSFSRFEYWSLNEANASANTPKQFWVMLSANGEVHLFGYETTAQIVDSQNSTHIAQWDLNASVSAMGEQIEYHYRAEDEQGCDKQEIQSHKNANTQRYLEKVYYGNPVGERAFSCTKTDNTLPKNALFTLVFDYGERDSALATYPQWQSNSAWALRKDCFSLFHYGFELRTRRLCRQVLMYHRLESLEKQTPLAEIPELVARLTLTYDESASGTVLVSAQKSAFNNNKDAQSLVTLPPVKFDWQMVGATKQAQWQSLEELASFTPQQPYQYVDLLGEGLAGVLYQDRGAWWYRAPVRKEDKQNPNAITWDKAKKLPVIPSLRNSAMLTDVTGDGKLEWLVTQGDVNGYYTQDETNAENWLNFVPLDALPVEYFHSRAEITSLTGSGFADLALIGPRSIRLYAGSAQGWKKSKDIMQADGVTLPIKNVNRRTLVAFSDVLGSGQQHLIKVDYQGVTCWVHLGEGRFSTPMTIPGFSADRLKFNPNQFYLADLDGSGTTDIIYAQSTHLEVYFNQSGNQFVRGDDIALPKGVRFDNQCQLQVADIQGLGVASILLTKAYPTPQHWVLSLQNKKPWLLTSINNNMGLIQNLHYRSSAQYWLDEKSTRQQQNKAKAVSHLPFALHTLWKIESIDEITQSRLTQTYNYRHGVWDGKEKEFRGFGCVEATNAESFKSEENTTDKTPSVLTRQWFLTGKSLVDNQFFNEFWQGDSAAFSHFSPRFTQGDGSSEKACNNTVHQEHAYWLERGLQGQLLRKEVYGLDNTVVSDVPYVVTEQRPQVRLIEAQGRSPVVMPSVVESRDYHYERIASDPACHQHIILEQDGYGFVSKAVSINYPRRAKGAKNPYQHYESLPETLWASSYDEQQHTLRLGLSRQTCHHLVHPEKQVYQLAITNASRQDSWIFGEEKQPKEGLNVEALLASNNLLTQKSASVFVGQQQLAYLDASGNTTLADPDFPVRLAYSETAELDEETAKVISQPYPDLKLDEVMKNAGYQQKDYLFADETEKSKKLWVKPLLGVKAYGSLAQFYKPLVYKKTELSCDYNLLWNKHFCVLMGKGSPLNTQDFYLTYDWRFLSPNSITDENKNLRQVTFDGFGRVTTTRFSGTEKGQESGYSQKAFTMPNTVDEALVLTSTLPIATGFVYVTDSWMSSSSKLPPHALQIMTDRYDSDSQQQIRQQIAFSDGFGRLLQTSIRVESGESFVRSEKGELVVDCAQQAQQRSTTTRWAISGETEYDNKGNVKRVYQPYFLNDWRYVSESSSQPNRVADTHYYDALGRLYQVITAKQYRRHTMMTPWFVAQEDENDTLV
ncbi:SpvB/TcaC N-terminal domain-containing protein [Proteus terrae]|uniref:SpvB/TcaC N-terminal domain-containing protein n=1 Tax=Proteus terrae TaxID=1574161 RepID=UPI00132F8BAF|nr:SpvB/TcaC N-terminal domain-containing protein [Proteus terrae]QKD68218.1 virulence protein [Proteus terrae subsp. cibarius]QKD73371.1 virulence protein [Proteus terrae subsp. cibarius]UDF25531.1 virulence protein [Proteus terrae subsp. cibarius]WCG86448.1 SpvB/TcaC N-terminal domain-containing protein [Proteus terrae]